MKAETLINALRILAIDIQTKDGIANSVIFQASYEIESLIKQRDELIEALSEVQEFLQYLWRDVAMNDYGADYRDRLERYVDEVIAKAKGEI